MEESELDCSDCSDRFAQCQGMKRNVMKSTTVYHLVTEKYILSLVKCYSLCTIIRKPLIEQTLEYYVAIVLVKNISLSCTQFQTLFYRSLVVIPTGLEHTSTILYSGIFQTTLLLLVVSLIVSTWELVCSTKEEQFHIMPVVL